MELCSLSRVHLEAVIVGRRLMMKKGLILCTKPG
jgi:hypothetical protein